jgi:hypothetical protein
MRYCSFCLLVLWSFSLAGQTAQNPLPNSDLKDPTGQRVQFEFHTLANSVQIYTCKQINQAFVWAGPDPDAILIDAAKTLAIHHYKGPVWEATEGSLVRSDGKLARHFLPDKKDAVHWLELPAQEPSKLFERVTFIRRIKTEGGLPPSDKACDEQHDGAQERVSYSATYLFYVPK